MTKAPQHIGDVVNRRRRHRPAVGVSLLMVAVVGVMVWLGARRPTTLPTPRPSVPSAAPGSVSEEPITILAEIDAANSEAARRAAARAKAKALKPSAPPPPERLDGVRCFVGEGMKFEFGWRAPSGIVRVPAAEARTAVDVVKHEGRPYIRFRGRAKTIGLVKGLWPMRDSVEVLIDAETLLVWRQIFRQNERGRRVTRITTFAPDGKTAERHKIRHYKPPGRRESRERLVCKRRLDAGGLTFFLRLMDVGPARDLVQTIFFEDKTNYRVNIKIEKRERITVPAGTFDAYRCRASFDDIGPVKKKDDKKKIKSATLWVSAGPERVPLRLRSETFVGSVYAELERYLPSPALKEAWEKARKKDE